MSQVTKIQLKNEHFSSILTTYLYKCFENIVYFCFRIWFLHILL